MEVEFKVNTELKLLRVKNNLTQDEMAAKLGYSRSMYSFVEQGKRHGTKKFWNKLQETFNLKDSEMWCYVKNE